MRCHGYEPLHQSADQDEVLGASLRIAAAAPPGAVAVLDLDGTLFDTRPRQVQIFREWGSLMGVAAVYRVQEGHFIDWSLPDTLLRAGLTEAEVAAHHKALRAHWETRFFSNDYVQYDCAMPGAAAFVWSLYKAGLGVVYLTGRHEDMRSGTEAMLLRCGFPLRRPRTVLLTKPALGIDDTAFKSEAMREVREVGAPVLFYDNEPSNVNLFSQAAPGAQVVFVETDHSPRPVQVPADVPRVRGFLWSPGAEARP